MPRVVRVLQLSAEGVLEPDLTGGLDDYDMSADLAGYFLEESYAAPLRWGLKAWSCAVVLETKTMCEQHGALPRPQRFTGAQQRMLQLRPVGRMVPVAASRAPTLAGSLRNLRPVRSGKAYRITSTPARGLVTPELADALETVFDRFARETGFTAEKPLEIRLARGFKAGSHGHGEGRAADIDAVAGKGFLEWKREWDEAMASAEKISDPQLHAQAIAAEQKRNLGYGLYKALQADGGWRVNPEGWRVYRGVMQLFGPWTATEGPWKTVAIEEPNLYEQQRMADQRWVFRAHLDHVHVAR